MNKTMILRIAIATPLWKAFDYLPLQSTANENLMPGVRVRVPFGRRQVIGILLEVVTQSEVPLEKLKRIDEFIDKAPILTTSLLKFCRWASEYYHYPIGEVVLGALPKGLRQGKSVELTTETTMCSPATRPNLQLNQYQQAAVDAIAQANGFQTFLLSGVTGSGKTEVYLHCIDAVLKKNQQALVLVPEIALTPQTVARFRERINAPVELIHSNLTDKTRMHAWLRAHYGTAAVIIGTRSAIFTSFLNLGIIILDEEHDPSFKQQSGFRYSARDLAVMRGRDGNIPVILGSATPSLESLYNVERRRYQLLTLPERAGEAKFPTVNLIDLRRQTLTAGISEALFTTMQEHLECGSQVMLFLNRRGYAPTLLCHHCGTMVQCRRCDARLTLHQKPYRLYCHHCGYSQAVPKVCPDCRQSELIDLGLGTEQLEEVLTAYFPNYPLVRVDRDSIRKKESMKNKLKSIHEGNAKILIGTQMLAKGHHFPNLTLVAVVDADMGLYSTDFRTLERMAQLLVQVSGRSGRDQQCGEVVIQTHHPDNALLNLLLQKGYIAFAKTLLKERKNAGLPPYSHWALLRAEAVQQALPLKFLEAAKQCIVNSSQIQILGPVPAPMERKAGRYRGQLLLQATQRSALQSMLKPFVAALSQLDLARKVRWSLDVDPQEV